MKSFKQFITETSVLMDLIDKYDDPFSFLASAMDAIANGTLKLKTRGMANARELIAAWNKVKKRKIKLKEAQEYIKEVIKVPISVGDTVLGGKFKNKRIVVKSIGKNEKGDITINGRPLLKYRILDEQYITEAKRIEYILWGVPPGERDETVVLDHPGGKPITNLKSAKKYKTILEKEHNVTKVRIQTIDFSDDLSNMFKQAIR